LISCATVQDDPVRIALYEAKQTWQSLREYVIGLYLDGEISEEEFEAFKADDEKFTEYYNLAKALYLSKKSQTEIDNAVDTLTQYLLKMNRKWRW
jgi:hypothetical protein